MSTPLPPTSDANPFRAPSARVADVTADSSSHLLDEPRAVEAGAPLRWISTGWTMFREAPGPWIGMALVYVLVLIVLGALPVIGILNNLLSPILAAGLMIAADGQREGQRPIVGQVFDGFKRNAGALALLGLLYMCAMLALALVAGVGIMGAVGAMMAGGGDLSGVGIAGIAGFAVLFVVLMMPLSFAMMWAPALVSLHALQAVPALKSAVTASLRNWAALLVLALVGLASVVLIVVTVGLGALVIGPTMFLAVYTGYREVFVR